MVYGYNSKKSAIFHEKIAAGQRIVTYEKYALRYM